MKKFHTMLRSGRLIGFALVLMLSLLVAMMPTAVQAAPASSEQAVEDRYGGHYYYVRYGDTLLKIAQRFGVGWRAIANANGLANPNRIYVGQRLYIPTGSGYPSGCVTYHWVQYGDTASEIAVHYGISIYALARANGITNLNRIYVGQRLCIPSGYHPGPSYQYYTVRSGDTLSEIASWHGTTVSRLVYLNGLVNPHRIYTGQVLRIW